MHYTISLLRVLQWHFLGGTTHTRYPTVQNHIIGMCLQMALYPLLTVGIRRQEVLGLRYMYITRGSEVKEALGLRHIYEVALRYILNLRIRRPEALGLMHIYDVGIRFQEALVLRHI